MHYKTFFRFMLIVVLIGGVSVSAGCSKEDEQKKKAAAEKVLQEKKREEIRERLREQVRKEQKALALKGTPGEKEITKKNISSAEACMTKFQRCTETCSGDRCESVCLKVLAACEKDLPKDVQTLKKD
jgi:hypothetical protein